MASRQFPQKGDIKIACFYSKDGLLVQEIIKKSFKVFVKQELLKSCS